MKLKALTSVVRLLLEGVSSRGIGRITGRSHNAIGQYVRRLGAAALHIQDRMLVDLAIDELQLDEMWTYIHGRSANLTLENRVRTGNGDIWVWMALDPKTKIIPFWLVGSRSLLVAEAFIAGLRARVRPGVKIVSDGFHAYIEAIDRQFLEANHRVAYEGFDRHSENTTNHVERHNLTLRTSLSRLRRNGNAQSRRHDALVGHLALYSLWYNFVRINQAIRVTPAMEAGLVDTLWSLEDMTRKLRAVAPSWLEPGQRIEALDARCVIDPSAARKLAAMRARRRDHRLDDPLRISAEWYARNNEPLASGE